MSRRETLRLRDIRDAIATIRGHIEPGIFDRKTSDAVLYNLVVIGEAASQISAETRDGAPRFHGRGSPAFATSSPTSTSASI